MINFDLYTKLKKSAKNKIILFMFAQMSEDFLVILEKEVEQGIYTQYEYEKFMTLIGFKRGAKD